MAEGRPGGNQGNPGADKWKTFFQYSRRNVSDVDNDLKRALWNAAEQASTRHGYQVAAERGTEPRAGEAYVAVVAEFYRGIQRNIDTSRDPNSCGYLRSLCAAGFAAVDTLLDPQSSGPVYYGGHMAHGIGTMAEGDILGGYAEYFEYGAKGIGAGANWAWHQVFG
jgi:hypothetical protein